VTDTNSQCTFQVEGSAFPDIIRDEGVAEFGLRVGRARACVIIPAYEASETLGQVIEDLVKTLPGARASEILVVDDGSTDETWLVGRESGARVFRHPKNLGKGAAIIRGLKEAKALGYEVALTVDADGQHPATSAGEILAASDESRALVLGVRNLRVEGAPRANQLSNGISNFFLSTFAHHRLFDTQCGLRRYPVQGALSLGARATGYAFEAEILLRAGAAGMPIVQRDIRVHYPPGRERVTHFDSVRDPIKIVATVLRTVYELRFAGKRRPWER
jgi:glycosyltransferase involved in cell wall biosynthesis